MVEGGVGGGGCRGSGAKRKRPSSLRNCTCQGKHQVGKCKQELRKVVIRPPQERGGARWRGWGPAMSRQATYVFSGGARGFSSGRPQGEIVTHSVVTRSEIHDMTAIIVIVTEVFYIY